MARHKRGTPIEDRLVYPITIKVNKETFEYLTDIITVVHPGLTISTFIRLLIDQYKADTPIPILNTTQEEVPEDDIESNEPDQEVTPDTSGSPEGKQRWYKQLL